MRTTALLCSLAVLAIAGCKETTTVPDIEHTTFAPALNIDLSTMTKTSGLYYKDLTVGGGAVIVAGQNIAIHYVGNLANGTQFDANSAPAAPFAFHLGVGEVIPGFDLGVAGMHVGGKRQIIIPPSLGYGGQNLGVIPPNSILVFTIDVVSAS